MIALLLTIVVGFTLLLTLLTYTLYCYEECNRTGRPLSRILPLAARTSLRSIVSEMLIIVLHPTGLWPGLWSRPTRGKDLVVLVHGLFHNPSAWVLFRRRLQAHGHATACFGYASWGADWDEIVGKLRSYLHDLLRTDPEREVHLVGHSLGGLLLCAALDGMEDAWRIRSLVTLGAPFRGSKLSPFALSSLGRYLGYDGEAADRLAAVRLPEHVRRLALRSPADNMVLPNSALRCPLPGWEERECPPVSHVAMLHSASVSREVQDWIDSKSATT